MDLNPPRTPTMDGQVVTWAVRLSEHLASTFVGRGPEVRLFRDVLRCERPEFQLLAITAPPGSGKTTLLKMYASLCDAEGVPSGLIDARGMQPRKESFLRALGDILDSGEERAPAETLSLRGRFVLMIDNFDALQPLHDWLSDELFAGFPDHTMIVVTGREHMPEAWYTDAVQRRFVRFLTLDNFSPEETRKFLTLRGVPAAEHDAVLDFSRGHPLAVSLLADVYNQRPGYAFTPRNAPHVIRALVRRFVGDVVQPSRREALEASALVRVTTESLLAALLDRSDVRAEFEWLCSLSFMQFSPDGIYPHDLVRDVLALDLLWRNPERCDTLKRRARDYYLPRLEAGLRSGGWGSLDDYVFLHRDHEVLTPFLQQLDGGAALGRCEPATIDDHPRLLELTERHEGEESARLLSQWLREQPEGAFVVRGEAGDVLAFMFIVRLHGRGDAGVRDDVITRTIWDYLQSGELLDADGVATIMRFLVDEEAYQSVSPHTATLAVGLLRHCQKEANLQFTFNVVTRPETWDEVAAATGFFRRAHQFHFELGNRPAGVFMQDWRREPPAAWLAALTPLDRDSAQILEQGNGLEPNPSSPYSEARSDGHGEQSPPVEPHAPSTSPASGDRSDRQLLLSRDEFANDVRSVLKNFHIFDALAANRLVNANLVGKTVGSRAPVELRVQTLRNTVTETVELLGAVPAREKLYKALRYTYLEPQGTQERTAEFLNIPFSTYRGHLRRGIAALTDLLWTLENDR